MAHRVASITSLDSLSSLEHQLLRRLLSRVCFNEIGAVVYVFDDGKKVVAPANEVITVGSQVVADRSAAIAFERDPESDKVVEINVAPQLVVVEP